jgi:uncharacterized membrane protein
MQTRLPELRPTAPVVSYYTRTYLVTTAVLVVAYTVLVLFHGPVLVQTALGLFAFFVAPGYGLCAALLGRGTTVPPMAFFAIVIGLSVVVNVLVGVILLVFGDGLPAQILGAVDSTVVIFGAVVFEFERPISGPAPAIKAPAPGPTPRSPLLRSILVPAGYSSGQRAVAYAILVATIAVFGYLAYISTVHPTDQPDVNLGVYGPGGNTNSLPASAAVGQVVAVNVSIGNNASTLAVNLVVQSYLNSTGPPANFTSTPWSGALALGPGVESEDSLQLPADAAVSLLLHFHFDQSGGYIVSISLDLPSGQPLRSVAFPIMIL